MYTKSHTLHTNTKLKPLNCMSRNICWYNIKWRQVSKTKYKTEWIVCQWQSV